MIAHTQNIKNALIALRPHGVIIDGKAYYSYAYAIANTLGEEGYEYFDALCQNSPNYPNERATRGQYNCALKSHAKQNEIYILSQCKLYGIRLNECKVEQLPIKATGVTTGVMNGGIQKHKQSNAKQYPERLDAMQYQRDTEQFRFSKLYTYFCKIFGRANADAIFYTYHVGGDKFGNTYFYNLGYYLQPYKRKKMQYNSETGHRVGGITIDNTTNANASLFGGNLLKQDTRRICIVESEKTALYLYGIFYDLGLNYKVLFLASGGETHLNLDNARLLEGKKVILFADADKVESWRKKAEQIRANIKNCECYCKAPTAIATTKAKNQLGEELGAKFDIMDWGQMHSKKYVANMICRMFENKKDFTF